VPRPLGFHPAFELYLQESMPGEAIGSDRTKPEFLASVLHAAEALADGRGLLVDVRDADGLGRAVLAILDDPALKAELERRAYDYGKEMAWPNVGRRVLALTRELVEPLATKVTPPEEPIDTEDTESPVHTA